MVNLRLEKILSEFCKARYLSKSDLRDVYRKTLLGEESKLITYLANHENVFQYERLIYDANSVLENY